MATSGGSGGNTTTAEAARTVYKDPSIRARLVDLCPEQFKSAYGKILSNSEYIYLNQLNKKVIVKKRRPAYFHLIIFLFRLRHPEADLL